MVRLAKSVILLLAILRVIAGAQLASFQAGVGGWQLGTIAVGDITGDAQLEIVVPYRDDNTGEWKLDAYDWRGNHLAGFPYNAAGSPINVSPTLYDIDGDGKMEIFFTAGPTIVALKGNGAVLWTRTVSSTNYVPDSGFQAVTNGFYMTPLGLFQPLLPPSAQFFSEVSPPIIADLGGSGALELLTAWKIQPDSLLGAQDFNPFINDIFGGSEWGATGESWSGAVIGVDARTGAPTLTYHFHQLVESGLAVGHADEDRAREVYVLNDSDSVVAFDRTQAPGFYGKGMLHKMFGKNQRLLSGSYLTGVDVYAADVDGDGRDEVLVASSQINPNWQPSETMLDDDGALMWRKWLSATSFPTTHGWFNSACMIPVNPDHDNQIDALSFTHSTSISFRTWNGVEWVDRPGWPKDFAPRLPTPPVVGDIDGDGEEEIIIGTYDPAAKPSTGNLYIFALDGTQKLSIPVAGGLKHIPAIADVNWDGSADLVYRALDGKVYVQNFGAKPRALISWATHRGNMRRDGNMGANLFPAGTPIITSRLARTRAAEFSWRAPDGFSPTSYQVERALTPNGSFASLNISGTHAVIPIQHAGEQNIFRARAFYPTGSVLSAPFAITALRDDNLIENGGFEENDNSHWDKWFAGDIPWTRMTVTTNSPQSGAQCMEIKLVNDGSQSSITQFSHYGIPESYLKTVPGGLYSFGGFIRSGGLSMASEHWFEWDSSRTGEHPEARPGLPWPSYFTPSAKFPTGRSDWVYLNRVFTMPPNFPNVELRHRFTVQNQASGSVFLDNIFFVALPQTNDARWIDLMPFGQTWRYSTSTPPTNWMNASFDDSTWAQGVAKFGAGTGPQNIRTPIAANKPAYYFRRSLTFATTNFSTLLLAATCTDDYGGAVYPMRLFVNGKEIFTSGIEAVTGEGNEIKYFDLTPFVGLFRARQTNQIAVVLQNTWQPDWDNVAFDLSFKAISQTPLSVPQFEAVNFAANSDAVSLNLFGPPNSSWILESVDNNSEASWAVVTGVTLDGNGTATVTDKGQNGRPLPSLVLSRFYRLRSP
jgi:hypothetical protein